MVQFWRVCVIFCLRFDICDWSMKICVVYAWYVGGLCMVYVFEACVTFVLCVCRIFVLCVCSVYIRSVCDVWVVCVNVKCVYVCRGRICDDYVCICLWYECMLCAWIKYMVCIWSVHSLCSVRVFNLWCMCVCVWFV